MPDKPHWSERAIKEKDLHEQRVAEFGQSKPGKKVGWSLQDTANELGISVALLSEDIRMAEAIALDPSFKNIKERSLAKQVILAHLRRLNQEFSIKSSGIISSECLIGMPNAILARFADEIFDACITETHCGANRETLQHIYRTLKNNTMFYAFTDNFCGLAEYLAGVGFYVQPWPLIWIKENYNKNRQKSGKTWEYQSDYEPILVAAKGSPATTSRLPSSIISCPLNGADISRHPREKPIALVERLIEHSTYDDAIILDPSAGTFVVPCACKAMNRRYVAITDDQYLYNKGLRRLGNDSGVALPQV